MEGTETEEVAAVDKPMVHFDEKRDRWVYRASALMSCQNALLLARQGVTGHAPPKKMQQRFDEGHEQEELILRKLDQDFGFSCYAQQQEVELPVGTGAIIVGHIDALSVLTNGQSVTSVDGITCDALVTQDATGEVRDWIAVVDAKAFAPSTQTTWANKFFESDLGHHYLWQQSTYLYAGDWDAIVMACKDKVSGELRVDVFTKAWIKERLPKSTLLQRVMWIESATKKGILFDDVCSPKMFPCPYYDMHPPEMAAEKRPNPDSDVDTDELQRLGVRVVELMDQAAQLAADIEKGKQDIANHVGNKAMALQHLKGVDVSAYFSGGATTKWTALAAALNMPVATVKEQFVTKTKSSKLTVKVAKPDAK